MDRFYEVEAVRIRGKSKDQLRRHKAPRLKATRNFIKVVSDKPLDQITTRDLFEFRQWWQRRVTAGEVEPATANKDMVYLMAMWKPVARDAQITLKINTDGVMFDEGKKKTRPPFSPAWIKDKLLPGIVRMNAEARGILEIMVNTGARPSEISALNHETICVDAELPYIHIRPEGRTLKSQFAERFIPLVGISLEAAKRNRAGLPTYDDNPSLSDTVNKFFEETGFLGYLMRIVGWPGAPLLLGFVLGPLMEEHLRRAMLMSRGDFGTFIDRPISATVLGITAALLLWTAWSALNYKRRLRLGMTAAMGGRG